MSSPAKTAAADRTPYHRLSDSEILLFVSRTLQPPLGSADKPTVFAKLQSLKEILDRQEALLADLPDGLGKLSIADGLASAKMLVAQIDDDLAAGAARPGLNGG